MYVLSCYIIIFVPWNWPLWIGMDWFSPYPSRTKSGGGPGSPHAAKVVPAQTSPLATQRDEGDLVPCQHQLWWPMAMSYDMMMCIYELYVYTYTIYIYIQYTYIYIYIQYTYIYIYNIHIYIYTIYIYIHNMYIYIHIPQIIHNCRKISCQGAFQGSTHVHEVLWVCVETDFPKIKWLQPLF